MTFAVGGPVLVVKDVNLQANPANLRVLRTLNGKPFPYDWQGELRGVVRARGGPVNRFVVDDARLVFYDSNVPGAVSRFSGRGELDILFPAYTVFRGFTTEVAKLDLRTLQYVNPDFPRLGGTVSGRAVLDSSWLDVRFRNAEMTHNDGPDLPSRFTGSGRVTLGDEFLTYDVDINAAPLSFTTLARSYPAIIIRGPHDGRIKVQGTLNNLVVTSNLAGAGGRFAVDGTFDMYPPRLSARASLNVTNLDLRTLLARDKLPHTELNGSVIAAVAGDSLANFNGTLGVELQRSLIDRLVVSDSRARLVLADGRMRVDTLALHSSAAAVAATGAIGLTASVSDSMRIVVNMDSLGGLRRYLRARKRPNVEGVLPRTTVAQADLEETIRDSLAGAARIDIMLRGSLDQLAASGTVDGRAFFVYGDKVERATGSFQLEDILELPSGQLALRLDTVSIAGIKLDSLSAGITMLDLDHMRFRLATLSGNGPTAMAAGSILRNADTTAITLDSVSLRIGRSRWILPAPAGVRTTPAGLELVNFRLRNNTGGWLELGGSLPLKHEVRFVVRADSVPLADLGTLAQMPAPLGGLGKLQWEIAGHREDPRMRVVAELRDVRYSGVNLERVEMRGTYADKRLVDTLILYRGGKPVLTADASLPVDLALLPVDDRLLGDSLSGSIRADSVELAVIEAFTPILQRSFGTLNTNVRLGGTVRRPLATGSIAITNGASTLMSAGVRLERINADIKLEGDIARIERLTMQSGPERGDTASLTGFVSFKRFENPEFGLSFAARSFRIIGRRSIADLQVTTPNRSPITLEGEFRRARLTGSLVIERGTIFIPELAEKRLTDLSDPNLALISDTAYAVRALLPDAPSELVENLQLQGVKIRIGDDVWIRSAEANIKLSGEVDVTRTHDPRAGGEARLALFGTLNADRGTYRLNLGIVQRVFDLENGTIRFFGDADLNPTMDINALHVVRQASNKQDIRIRVHLGGTLLPPPGPELAFSSADGYRIDQPQLLSYLITGAPTFETAETEDETVTEKAVGVALRSAGGYLSSRLSGALGLDVVQVQTSGGTGLLRSRQAGSAGLEYLRNTRIGVGKQLNERLFVSANTGLCKFDVSRLNSSEYLQSVGVKVDYRLPKDLVVSAGTEPEASALICTAGNEQLRGFIATPRQWGFDLTKTWKF
jgi:translocation and assembly module TamB